MATRVSTGPSSPEEQQKLRDKVVGLVRAILIPEKHGLPLEKVNREYRGFNGENIPYRRMGYATVEDFLDQNPQMCRIQRKQDGYYLFGVATAETAHIANMVAKQRSSKRKAKPKPARRPHFNPAQQRLMWTPPAPGNNFQQQGRFPPSQRPSGSQYNRKFPGSGRFPTTNGMPSSSNQVKGRGQSGNKLRTPNIQNNQGNNMFRSFPTVQSPISPQPVAMHPANRSSSQSQPVQRNNSNNRGQKQLGGNRLAIQNGQKSNNNNLPVDHYRQLLTEYFKKQSLGEIAYGTVPLETKTGGGQNQKTGQKGKTVKKYMCTVKVHGKSYKTYPYDFPTEEMAEETAAKNACTALEITRQSLSSIGGGQSVQPTPSSNGHIVSDTDFGTWSNGTAAQAGVIVPESGSDLYLIVDRIISLVGSRSNGVWSTQIVVEYSKKFKSEPLPDRWIEQIEKSTYGQLKLRVDRPIQDMCIILPNLQPHDTHLSVDITPKIKSPALSLPAPSPSAPSPSAPSPSAPSPSAPSPSVQDQLNNLTISKKPSPSYDASRGFNGNDVEGQTRPPQLKLPEDTFWNVYITCVYSTINVGLRLLGDSYSTEFDELVTNMELHYLEWEKVPPIEQPVVIGKLYVAKVEGDWHRVEVTNVKGIDITCYFIDHGDEEVFTSADLREIDTKFLALAPQAEHVRLAGLEAFKDSSDAHVELSNMALGKSLVGSVYTNDENGVSLMLIDTSGDDSDLNINQVLAEKMSPSAAGDSLTKQQRKPDGPPPLEVPVGDDFKLLPQVPQDSKNEKPEMMTVGDLMNLDLASLKPLIRMDPPVIDSFFDVSVTTAASPSNFQVQSYAEEKSLEEMQCAMNAFYSDEARHYSEPLGKKHLEKDAFFAVKHSDGVWYRVRVNSVLDDYTAAVKMVDYGHYSMAPLDQMQPLWPQFRNLPMQSINVSLADIVAANGDWTPDDAVWFTKRVVGKQFVSKVKDISYDIADPDGENLKLSVSLFDTSDPHQDIVIDKELVDKGKAVYLCV